MRRSIFEACKEVPARDAAAALGLRFGRGGRVYCPLCNSSRANMSFGNGMFHCFACHAGGDAVKLVSLVLGLSALDAARWVNREFGCGYDEDTGNVSEEARQHIELRKAVRRAEERNAARRAEYCELVIWAERYVNEHVPLIWDGMDGTYMALLGMRHLFDAIWAAGTDRGYVPAGWLDEEVNRLAAIRNGAEPNGAGQRQVGSDKSGDSRPVRRRVADGRARHSGVLRTVHPHGP